MPGNGKTSRMFWLTPVCGAAAGVVFLAGRRSETVRGLLDRRDERLSAIDVRAAATSGLVLILVVIGAAVVELARGHSGAPYTWLGAVSGLAYLAAIAVQRIKG
jgi:hypothetical protein